MRASFLLAVGLIAGCKKGDSGARTDAPAGQGNPIPQTLSPWKAPGKYAEAFKDYRRTWPHLTGYEFSGLHWNQHIVLYMNKDAQRYVRNYLEYVRLYVDQDGEGEDAGDSRFEPYIEGTIFLKENYLSKDAKPDAPATITAMIKREKGYDPGSNDWQFLQWDTDGNLLIDGNGTSAPAQALCIKCHANMAERDFVFSTFCNIATPSH